MGGIENKQVPLFAMPQIPTITGMTPYPTHAAHTVLPTTLRYRAGRYTRPMGQQIKTDGTISTVRPADGHEFTLQEVVRYIGGGYTEALFLDGGEVMYFDEEGKLKGLPINAGATLYAYEHSERLKMARDTINGDALLCEPGETS